MLFQYDTILEIHKKALEADLHRKRDLLLQGLDIAYIADFARAQTESAQLLSDLNRMNDKISINGEIPLRRWLTNAVYHTGLRAALQEPFKRFLAELVSTLTDAPGADEQAARFTLDVRQEEELSRLLENGFDDNEVKKLFLVMLEIPLEVSGAATSDKRQIITSAVRKANQQGRTALVKLLCGAVTLRPHNFYIKAFGDLIFPGEVQSIEGGKLADRLSRGLVALASYKNLPIVQQTIGRFRADFEVTSQQIHVLKKYKSLHDSLHRLQLKSATIRAAFEAAKATKEAARMLALHAIELRPMANKARQQARGLPGEKNEISWIDDFEAYLRAMEEAASRAVGPGDLGQLADDLEELLGELPRINNLLAHVAASLPLNGLITAIGDITTFLNETRAFADNAALRLTADLTALEILRPQFQDLIEQHFTWQRIDRELSAARLFSDHGSAICLPPKRWPNFKKHFAELCDRHPYEGWSQDLKARMNSWEKSIFDDSNCKEDEADNGSFDEFYSACSMRFFEVDSELNELCLRLAEVAAPVDVLLLAIRT
jgi:Effector-associated domain 5